MVESARRQHSPSLDFAGLLVGDQPGHNIGTSWNYFLTIHVDRFRKAGAEGLAEARCIRVHRIDHTNGDVGVDWNRDTGILIEQEVGGGRRVIRTVVRRC